MTELNNLAKVRIKIKNPKSGTEEIVEGKLESNIIESFYIDG